MSVCADTHNNLAFIKARIRPAGRDLDWQPCPGVM